MAAFDEQLVNETTPILDPLLDELLYARHVEVQSAADMIQQRGTPIPALFNTFYKFVQNPSSVSVDTFKRMIDTDDTIGSGVDFLTTCLAARLGRYTHKNPEISEWVNKAIDAVEGGFANAVKELLSASWAGFAVQEQVWANDPELGFIVRKLVSMPPQTLLFETERTGELTLDGILQYQRNYNPALASGNSYLFGFAAGTTGSNGYRPDPYAKLGDLPYPLRTANTYSYLAIRIPKAKCIHYSFDAQGKFGNPYGRSLLRRCYKYYVMKDAFLSMLSVALDRKGTPLTIVYADGQQTLRDPTKVGDTQYAGNNRGAGIRADVAARNAFRNIHNDSVIILPGKKGQVFEHDVVAQSSNANDFLEALKFCNASIMRALLIPSLIFTNGDGTGSYSLGQEHAKTFDKILDGWLEGFTQVLLDQYVGRMLKLNFPRSMWENEGLGEFSKRELSQDEIEKELKSIETAVNIGAIDMGDLEDLNQVRDKIGFKERTQPIAQAPEVVGYDEMGNPITQVPPPPGGGVPPGPGMPPQQGEPPAPGQKAPPAAQAPGSPSASEVQTQSPPAPGSKGASPSAAAPVPGKGPSATSSVPPPAAATPPAPAPASKTPAPAGAQKESSTGKAQAPAPQPVKAPPAPGAGSPPAKNPQAGPTTQPGGPVPAPGASPQPAAAPQPPAASTVAVPLPGVIPAVSIIGVGVPDATAPQPGAPNTNQGPAAPPPPAQPAPGAAHQKTQPPQVGQKPPGASQPDAADKSEKEIGEPPVKPQPPAQKKAPFGR